MNLCCVKTRTEALLKNACDCKQMALFEAFYRLFFSGAVLLLGMPSATWIAVAGFVASALSMYNYVGWADAEAGLARLEAEL